MKTLKSFASSLNLSLEVVWKELEVFSKLLVRGRNQHRRDKCYQMLVRVNKDVKRYQKVSFSELKQFAKRPRKNTTSVEVVRKKTCCFLRFTESLIEFLEKTFEEVQRQLHRGLFIPTNLLMLASVSRIWYMFQYHRSILSSLLCELTGGHGQSSAALAGDVIGTAVPRSLNPPLDPVVLTMPQCPISTCETDDSALLSSGAREQHEIVRVAPAPDHRTPESCNIVGTGTVQANAAAAQSLKHLPTGIPGAWDSSKTTAVLQAPLPTHHFSVAACKKRRRKLKRLACVVREQPRNRGLAALLRRSQTHGKFYRVRQHKKKKNQK